MEKNKQWQPPWKVHLPVWAITLGVSFWALQHVGGWAILIFIGFMVVWGLIIAGIQQQKERVAEDELGIEQQKQAEYAKFRDRLLEDPELRAMYDADQES